MPRRDKRYSQESTHPARCGNHTEKLLTTGESKAPLQTGVNAPEHFPVPLEPAHDTPAGTNLKVLRDLLTHGSRLERAGRLRNPILLQAVLQAHLPLRRRGGFTLH